ncbi:MAG TPA: hypothetical protein VGY98_16325 [Verrucomicrobiae bacterium]|nr:hypothetical protein [Verrucomicrobiae bacterium]
MRINALIDLVAALAMVSSARAMDRWAALSMIESGNDDTAIGSLGEVSRFQIRPYLWPGGNPQNAGVALDAAQKIMKPRVNKFKQSHNRVPNDFEFYVLWNAPQEVDHPCRAVAKRAHRYANLVQRSSAGYASR